MMTRIPSMTSDLCKIRYKELVTKVKGCCKLEPGCSTKGKRVWWGLWVPVEVTFVYPAGAIQWAPTWVLFILWCHFILFNWYISGFLNQDHPLIVLSEKRNKKFDLTLLLCLTCQPTEHFLRNIPRTMVKWDWEHDLHLSLPFAMPRSFSNCCPKHEAPGQAQTSNSNCI